MPAFTHGKAARVFMEDLNLSDYMRSVSVPAEADVAESSTFGADWKQYVVGLRDATISGEGIFDVTEDAALIDSITVGGRSKWQVYFAGDAVGSPGRGLDCDTTGYEPSADIGDVVMWSVEAQSSVGADRIISHHAHAERTTSGTAAVVDNTAGSTTTGAVAYLNVTAISGSAVVVLQDSADNITYADLISFGTVSATGGYRGTATGQVDRYTRLVHTNAAGTITFVAGLGRAN
ncbi:hypothetical protein [Microcystis phage Mae-JY09]